VNIYSSFIRLADLPAGFLAAHNQLLNTSERLHAETIVDWIQRSEWCIGRILMRLLVGSARNVSVSDITIHTQSNGLMVAETPNGRVNVSHARIPGHWVGAVSADWPVGIDIVQARDFPVDVNGVQRGAKEWAGLEALAKVTQMGLAWALTAACYPVDGLVTTPSGEHYRALDIPISDPEILVTMLVAADANIEIVAVDLLSNAEMSILLK